MMPRSNESSKRLTRRTAVVLACAMSAAVTVPAAASAAATQTTPPCVEGYVLLLPAVGPALKVCAPQSDHFAPPLRDVVVANDSPISYYVETALIGYASLPPGASLHAATVYGINPGQACPG